MLVDIRSLDQAQLDVEICIIGGGPAGLALAQMFIQQNVAVALLESGGIERDIQVQELAEGENFGQAMPPMEVCNRQLGGNSHAWSIKICPQEFGVRYALFDELDFERRDWVPHSGWPFSRDHLIPYYERAQQLCQLGPFAYDAEAWEDEQAQRLPIDAERVETGVFQFGPSRAFYQDAREAIEASKNVTIYTHATVTEIRTNESGQAAESVCIKGFSGKETWLTAKVFILAAGGFQNARLLLASNQQQPAGLGNQNDVVGRYYHDHPQAMGGYFIPRDRQLFNRTALYDLRQSKGIPIMGFLRLSRQVQEQEQLLNCNAILYPRPNPRATEAIRSFKHLGRALLNQHNWVMNPEAGGSRSSYWGRLLENLPQHVAQTLAGADAVAQALYLAKFKRQSLFPNLGRGGWSDIADNSGRFQRFELLHLLEQSPDPNNRVALSRDRDALGCPKLALHWQWSQDDAERTVRAQQRLAQELSRSGLGEIQIELDDAGHPKIGRPTGSAHLMGTTRMNDNPKYGVVDADCRVHGIGNLFVAGSSTFPTGGYANPTLTIIAMALRLGDLVQQELPQVTAVSLAA